jgi:hypothetical protein
MPQTGGGGGGGTGQALSDAQIIALWMKAGGQLTNAPMALARALSESSGRAWITSANPDGGTNVGVWQLDTKGVGSGYTVKQLQDPLTNAKITVKATGGGTNWAAWADNFQDFLGQADQAVQKWKAAATAHTGGAGGYIDELLKGIEGIGHDIGHALGNLLQLPSQVTDFLTALEKPVQGLMWFVNPANWARIIAGFFGFLLLGAGLITLGLAA